MTFIAKHGMAGTRLYRAWTNMRNRCNRKADKEYKHYGGRGIKVCEEWQNDFETFKEWALSNGYDDKLTLDRIDTNGNYEPNNCRWITRKEQNNNMTSNVVLTVTHNLTEWSEITGINYPTLQGRIRRGWKVDDILFKPIKKAYSHPKYAEQSGWEEMTVPCKHCGKDMTFKIATIGEPCDDCKYKTFTELYFHTDPEMVERIEYGTDGNAYKLWISNGKEFEQEPCEDAKSTKAVMKILTTLMSEAGKDGKLILSDAKEMIMDLPSVQSKQEPCDDAVSRQAVLDYLKTNVDDFPDYHEAIEKVLQIPSVRPQEQKGHWIIDEGSLDALYGEVCKCSKCGVESIGESDYCPYCGAKMVEPQESESDVK